MSMPRTSIIAAVGQRRELGKKNELIWRIGADLKRVKELTMGHPIIMGLNTYNSIGRPLPGRTNIVLSFTPITIPGCIVMNSLETALEHARSIETEEIFIFGGASVYVAALPLTHRLYLTRIEDTEPEADAFFPEYDMFTKIISKEEHLDHIPPFTWLTLERK